MRGNKSHSCWRTFKTYCVHACIRVCVPSLQSLYGCMLASNSWLFRLHEDELALDKALQSGDPEMINVVLKSLIASMV